MEEESTQDMRADWVFRYNIVKDEASLALYTDLENKNVIGLKYCAFEDLNGGLKEITTMLHDFGWENLCQVGDMVYIDLVK